MSGPTNLALLVLRVALGAGRGALDHVAGIADRPGWTGLVIGLVAGGGGAGLLLAGFWRPGRPT